MGEREEAVMALIGDLTKHHRERPDDKSHPGHCAACYWPWPCPNVRAAGALNDDWPCLACGMTFAACRTFADNQGYCCEKCGHKPPAPPSPSTSSPREGGGNGG